MPTWRKLATRMGLDAATADALERLCEVLVPGSARVGSAAYVEALIERMPDGPREGAIAAVAALGELARGGAGALAERAATPDFQMLRALAIEAYYSDYLAPGRDGPGAWEEIDFRPPGTAALRKDFSFLGLGG